MRQFINQINKGKVDLSDKNDLDQRYFSFDSDRSKFLFYIALFGSMFVIGQTEILITLIPQQLAKLLVYISTLITVNLSLIHI